MLTNDLMAKIRRIELRTRRLVNDSFAGEYHSVFKGRGMEFDEVRPYQPGDEVRTIDWNVTARMNEPYVKRYVEARELSVMLVVDASGSNDYGTTTRFKREIAAELAAVLSFAATNNNDKVGLLIFTDKTELYIPRARGAGISYVSCAKCLRSYRRAEAPILAMRSTRSIAFSSDAASSS